MFLRGLRANPTVRQIICSSLSEGCLPTSFKEADIVPVPKKKPIRDINKDLRPISLTPILSKIAEDFIVNHYLKPAVLKKIDKRQYGTIPKSCTTNALISMTHNWYVNTDGNGATSRIVLFDYRKAFDLIDHNILAEKLSTYDIPLCIKRWIVDFLMNRKQRVKLSHDCLSEWGSIPSGIPQGTKMGPWLFLVMINDIDAPGVALWKYVDDITMTETVRKGYNSNIQKAVDILESQSRSEGLVLNEEKCKEIRVCFAKTSPDLASVQVNGKPLDVINHSKVLGLHISNDLKWNVHVSKLAKKARSRLYFLRQLKRSRVASKDLILFYITCVRSILEYACPVFHRALPKYLSDDLESLQKRALRTIYPTLSYKEALTTSCLPKLYDRRELISKTLFDEIKDNPNHQLNHLLPDRYTGSYNLRKSRSFQVPLYSTKRCKSSFIISHSK